MARFQSPNSGDIIDIEDDYDTSTGVNNSAEKAKAKGWKPVHRLVSKAGKEINVSDDALDGALAKGWQLSEVAAGNKQADEQYAKAEKARLDTPMGRVESGARSFAQAATFNGADEIGAGVGALLGQGNYSDLRDRNRTQDKIADEVNPKSSMVGTVGAIAPSFLAGGAASLASKGLGRLAGEGAVAGAVSGAGASEESSLAGIGKDAVTSGLVGGAVPLALGGAGKALKAGYDGAKTALNPSELRAKVVSSMLKDYKGPKGADFDKEKSRVMKAVKALEAKGFFNGPGTLTREGLFNKAGDTVESLNDEAQSLLTRASPNARVTREEIVNQLDDKALTPWYNDTVSKKLTSSEAGSKADLLEELIDTGSMQKDLSLMDAQRIKRGLQSRANELGAYKSLDPTSGVQADVAERAASAYRQALEDGVDKGLPSAGAQFKDLNQYQSSLLDARNMLGDGISRNSKNMPLSLTTGTSMAGAGSADLATGSGGIMSAITAGVNVARQPWARLVMAKLGDKVQDSETLKRTLAFLKPLVDKGGDAVLNSKTINAAARMAGANIGEKD